MGEMLLHLRLLHRRRSLWSPYRTKNRTARHLPSCWTLPLGGRPISSGRCPSRSRRQTKRGSFGGLRSVSCGRRVVAEQAVLLLVLSTNTTAMRSFTATSIPTIAPCALKKVTKRRKMNVMAREDMPATRSVSTWKKIIGCVELRPNSKKRSQGSTFPTNPTPSFPHSWQSHGMSGRRPTRPTSTEFGPHSIRWNRMTNTSPGNYRSWTKCSRGLPNGSWQGSVSGEVPLTRACGGFKISTSTLRAPILKSKLAITV